MKARWKILIAMGAFVAMLTGIWLITMRFQPETEVDAYKRFLFEKGEKLKISEVLPPLVPPESNGVALVQSAFVLFDASAGERTNWPPAMRLVEPGKAMVGWAQGDLRDNDFTNTWAIAYVATKADFPATELLWRARNYPTLDFQPDYSRGVDMLLAHLTPLKRSAQRLSAAAMCGLHNGDEASATTNLCALLALAQGIHDERTIISQLVRIAMTSIAASASWELLQSTNVTDAELVALQKSWERLEFIKSVENSVLMERASIENTITKMRASQAEFDRVTRLYSSFGGLSGSGGSSPGGSGNWWDDLDDFAKEGLKKAKFVSASFMWRNSWTYSDELNALKNYQDTLEALRAIETKQFFQPAYSNLLNQLYPSGMSRLYHAKGVANIYDEFWHDLDEMNLREYFSGSAGSLTATVRKAMAAEASKRIVITAIALKRFYLRHGNFPEKISELTPAFLPDIPLDAVDGQPLRYRRSSDGAFLLYSIGDDGVDDGGDPSSTSSYVGRNFYWQGSKVLDWVWPQPATEAEIQQYYEEQAKKSD